MHNPKPESTTSNAVAEEQVARGDPNVPNVSVSATEMSAATQSSPTAILAEEKTKTFDQTTQDGVNKKKHKKPVGGASHVDIILSTVQDDNEQTEEKGANEGGSKTENKLDDGQDADNENEDDDVLPSDFIPPNRTSGGERKLSIQMGAVMVSFDVECHENDDVDEKELLSGYKTPTYNTAESPVREHQSPEHRGKLQKKRSRDEMQTLLKEHQEIVNKLKEQERNLSDSEHQDTPTAKDT